MTRPEIHTRLAEILADQFCQPAAAITETLTFDDLGADSLDLVEIVMAVEETFALNISDEDAEPIRTIAQALDYLEKHLPQFSQ